MGSGKSTIGKSLAERLNMEFIDTDSVIEKKLSKSVAEIFRTEGEEFFRKLEMEESIKFAEKERVVIALGGGAFINREIREKLKKTCFSVWLQLDTNKIFERTKNNQKRPLLNINKSKEEFDKLYESRKKIYSLADFKINCNDKDKNEIVKEIKNIYEST